MIAHDLKNPLYLQRLKEAGLYTQLYIRYLTKRFPSSTKDEMRKLAEAVLDAEKAKALLDNPKLSKIKKRYLREALAEISFLLKKGGPMTPSQIQHANTSMQIIEKRLSNPELTSSQRAFYKWIVQQSLSSRNRMVQQTLRISVETARQVYARHERLCKSSGITFDDLIQQGSLGLIEAASKYNPDKGASFFTYASHRARGEMLTLLREHAAMIKVPREVLSKIQSEEAFSKARAELLEKIGKAPKGEVRESAIREIARLRELKKGIRPLSGSAEVPGKDGGKARTGFDLVESDARYTNPLKTAESRDLRRVFKKELRRVFASRDMCLLMELRYLSQGEQMTLKEIGNALGRSESRASQLHTQALELLVSKPQLLKLIGLNHDPKKNYSVTKIKQRLEKSFGKPPRSALARKSNRKE